MKASAVVIALLSLFVMSSEVSADESSNAKTNWSIGAGVGINLYQNYSEGLGLSSTNYITRTLSGIFLERRMSKRLFFLFDVKGGYSKYNYSYDERGMYNPKYSWNLSANAGVRYIFNPGGIMELSGFLLLGYNTSKYKITYRERNPDSESPDTESIDKYIYYDEITNNMGAGATMGFTLERKLIDRLILRFEATVIKISWMNSRTKSEDPDGDNYKGSSFDAGLAITPSIQLRFEI